MLLSGSVELADLLAATGRGDRQAFRMVYDHTSSKLFGVVLRIVRSREVAAEVLQEAYLRIWQKAASFDSQAGRPMTWMIAIARNAAIDLIRKGTDAAPLTSADAEMLASTDNPERDLIVHDQLGRCLQVLGQPQLQCVLLAYCSGYSREELAIHFDRPVATVKSWLHRALLSLRQCLEES